MPRAIWSGSISFGLVAIDVKLYPAVTERAVRFNQIDTRNGARIRTRRVNADDGSEVPPEALAKGYEVSKGRFVIVTEDELASIQPRATHTIDLEHFVDLDQVDPIYFDRAYWVAPDGRAAKPYGLLVRAMEAAGKVAIARFVMRTRQYVAVMRPHEGRLVLSMLVYAEELNPATTIPELEDPAAFDVDERELTMAEQLIDSLTAEFDPASYHDSYREALLDMIHAKDAGEVRSSDVTAESDDGTVVDLMAALEASVAAAREARGRHPSAGAVPVGRSATTSSTAKKAPAKKATTKKASVKKATAKKATAQRPAGKVATARRPAPKKVAAEEPNRTRAAAKEASANQPPARTSRTRRSA